jgi:hypothetical protein
VIFTEPSYPEYELINRTNNDLRFGQVKDDLMLKTLQKIKKTSGAHTNLDELVIGEDF